ncbi:MULTISPECIES: hypothetical protein [unclassified Flavobacterium]|uniref:hypothetical protein n=1 Tax=unclassified Flavobacterium TaxID=196869 RepID=UPI003F900397
MFSSNAFLARMLANEKAETLGPVNSSVFFGVTAVVSGLVFGSLTGTAGLLGLGVCCVASAAGFATLLWSAIE